MQRLALVLVALLCSYSYSNAQVANTTTGQTGDIIILGNGWTGTLSSCTHNYDCWAGSSDNGDIHESSNPTGNGTTYYWSGTQQTLSNTIALNQALQAAGIQVDGFDYQWVYKNGNANWFSGQPGGGGVDPFEVVVNVYDSNGNLFKSYKYDYGQNFANWTYDQGTETFNQNYLTPSYFGNVEILVTGQDIAGQAGYWGPEFRADESYIYVNYSPNPCHNNPLYDPQCPGYANALFLQQCTTNPLFDPTCPGYASANLTQQCSANPLYDPACPGYAAASFAQQCDWDPLSDVQCPNYQKAWLEKKCDEDPLYDVQCAGYQTAIELSKIVDDGKDDPLIVKDDKVDVTTTTEIEGVPNVISLPEQQTIEVVGVEDGDGFQEVEDDIQKEQMAMEDDIEKEIEELENAAGGEMMDDDIEKEIAELENETSEDGTAPDMISGGANQEDDIEKELAELKDSTKSENKQDAPKPKTRNEKIKILLAMKAIELTKKLEKEVSLEQNMILQRQLLALISYVPGFDYNEKENLDGNFYPPKPTVDHAFARWFLNDPNFGAMENLQYPNLN
jgi:hypothetical protein